MKPCSEENHRPATAAVLAGTHQLCNLALTSLLPCTCPTDSACGDMQHVLLHVLSQSPGEGLAAAHVGVPAPGREAGPPRCRIVPHSQSLFQPSGASVQVQPHPHPTLVPSPEKPPNRFEGK